MRRVLVATVAALAILVLPAPQAQANTCGLSTACFTNYYSSAAHTSLVGYYNIYCGGAVSRWGTTSPYYTYSVQSCTP